MKHSRMRHSSLSRAKMTTYMIWVVLAAALVFIVWAQNNLIVTKNFIFSTQNLRKSLVGYKIVHVTDICNSGLDVASKVKKLDPDIIVVSGGYMDDKGKYNNSVKTINKLSKIAPTYYVYGSLDEEDCLSGTNATNISNDVVELLPKDKDVEQFIKDNYGDEILKEAEKGNETAEEYLSYIKEELEKCKDDNVKLGLIGLDMYVDDEGNALSSEALDEAYELLLDTDAEYTVGIIGNVEVLEEVAKSRLNAAFVGGTYGVSKEYKKGMQGIKNLQVFSCGGIGTRGNVRRVFNFPEIQCVMLTDSTIQHHNPLEKFIGSIWKDVGTVFDNDGGFTIHRYTIEKDN